jgi:hypothetical protein
MVSWCSWNENFPNRVSAVLLHLIINNICQNVFFFFVCLCMAFVSPFKGSFPKLLLMDRDFLNLADALLFIEKD